MASFSMSSSKLLLLFFILLNSLPTHSFEFEAGDTNGWTVPSTKKPDVYNEWASKNRFQIGDTIHFKYKKDSVMVVTKAEYEKCHSSRPIFFSNGGRTEFTLERSGLYYFISGVAGHCERGEKMIIRVLSHGEAPGGSPSESNETATPPPPPHHKSDAVSIAGMGAVQVVLLLIASFLF